MPASARLLLALALALPAAAIANTAADAAPEFDATLFAEQKDAMLAELRRGSYRNISDRDKTRVVEALDRMQVHLAEVTSIQQLDDRSRIAVFNDQELINTILTDAEEDSRMVCVRETRTGSHFQSNSCKTVAQRREAREKAIDGLRRNIGTWPSLQPPSEFVPPGGGQQL